MRLIVRSSDIPTSSCSYEQCHRVAKSRGYCGIHNKQLRASGELPTAGTKGCSEAGCSGKHKGLGLCIKHLNQLQHQRRRQSASVEDLPRAREVFEEVGWTVSDSGCWLWAGSLDISGYGRFPSNPISDMAHRVSYSIHSGLIARGMQVHHKCAVRQCVNPEHLQSVTAHENTAEMLERREYKRQIAALKKEVARLNRELERLAA